jgi:hypothetical protein
MKRKSRIIACAQLRWALKSLLDKHAIENPLYHKDRTNLLNSLESEEWERVMFGTKSK